MYEIWMVEWSGTYADCNAAFSTRDKAIAYIQHCAECMNLYKRGFCMIMEDQSGEEPWWGVYEFEPAMECGEIGPKQIRYQRYDIDLY